MGAREALGGVGRSLVVVDDRLGRVELVHQARVAQVGHVTLPAKESPPGLALEIAAVQKAPLEGRTVMVRVFPPHSPRRSSASSSRKRCVWSSVSQPWCVYAASSYVSAPIIAGLLWSVMSTMVRVLPRVLYCNSDFSG